LSLVSIPLPNAWQYLHQRSYVFAMIAVLWAVIWIGWSVMLFARRESIWTSIIPLAGGLLVWIAQIVFFARGGQLPYEQQ
jgi:peptidoglycan biosynthesis protein MviN/MurJ (putative lipid II flippase)